MPMHLDRILEATRLRLAAEMKQRSLNDLEREIVFAAPPRDFAGALSVPGMSLMAEIKRSSPSAGEIRPDADTGALAEAYERGGAKAISVLTEPDFFGGSLDDLGKAKSAVQIPVLRKDFLIDPHQVFQARVAQADAVLLIIAALRDRVLYREMHDAARACNLSVLVEVHDPYELEAAFEADPRIIGVNQRNLKTFEVDTSLAVRLRGQVPGDVVMVAESGIKSRADVEELEKAEVNAVLVGETLMRSDDPSQAVRTLLGRGEEND